MSALKLGNAQKWAAAATHLNKALALTPNDPHSELAIGKLPSGAGRDVEAAPHLRRAVDGDPALVLNGYELAMVLANTGDWSKPGRH